MTGAEYWTGCAVSLIAHEAGHICAASTLGLRVKRIGISRMGPYIVREAGSPAADAVVSAAGPLVNLSLAVLLWQHWPSFALINLIFWFYNMLPFPSSDGRRIVSALSLARDVHARMRLTAVSPAEQLNPGAPWPGFSLRV